MTNHSSSRSAPQPHPDRAHDHGRHPRRHRGAVLHLRDLYADVLWYDQLGFLEVLTTQWVARAVMFLVGFVGMALPVWLTIEIAYRSRPVYAKLNSQLDRYQQVVEPLRRLAMFGIPLVLGIFAGVSTATPLGDRAAVAQPHAVRPDRPAVRARLSFYVYELPFYRGVARASPRRSCSSRVRRDLATCYLYGAHPDQRPRGARHAPGPHPARHHRAALYLALQAASIWLDQYATLTDDGDAHHRRRRTPTSTRSSPAGRSSPASPRSSPCSFIVTAIIGRWRLPLIGTALLIVSSLVIGVDLPVDRPALPGRPERAHARGRVHPAQHRRDARGVRRRRHRGDRRTRRRPTPRRAQLREDAETTANIRILDPAVVSPTVRAARAVPAVLPVPRAPRRRPLRDRRQDAGHRDRGARAQPGAARRRRRPGSTTRSSTRTATASSPRTATSARPTASRCSSSRASRRRASSASSSRASTSARTRRAYSIVGGPASGEPARARLPVRRRRGRRQRRDHDLRRRRRAEARQRLQAPGLRAQVPVRADRALDSVTDDSQILYDRDPLDARAEGRAVPDARQRHLPGVVDGRVVWIVDGYTHDATSYPYSHDRAAVATRSPTPTRRRPRSRSTTSTTSATR